MSYRYETAIALDAGFGHRLALFGALPALLAKTPRSPSETGVLRWHWLPTAWDDTCSEDPNRVRLAWDFLNEDVRTDRCPCIANAEKGAELFAWVSYDAVADTFETLGAHEKYRLTREHLARLP